MRAPVDPHRRPSSQEASFFDDGVGDTIPAEKTVLVEAISPVGAAEPCIPWATDVTPAMLSCNAFNRELRMRVLVLAQDGSWVYRVGVV